MLWTIGFLILGTLIIGAFLLGKLCHAMVMRGMRKRAEAKPVTAEVTAASMLARATALEAAEPAAEPVPYDLHDTPDMTGPVTGWEPAPELKPDVQADRDEGERLLGDLFSAECPDCLQVPGATGAGLPCAMGIGIPVAMVRRQPLAFCHYSRMAAAIASGAADRDEVIARFGGRLPAGVIL